MDRIEKMQMFVAVVEAGSFSAAAQRLGISNKQISKGIRALEEDVGATLLFRTTRSMSITSAGKTYLNGCRRVLLEYDVLSASLEQSQGLRGTLRVAAPVTFGEVLVTQAVVTFMNMHPDIEVDLVLSDAFEDLAEQGFDLAIRIGHLKDSSLRVRSLGDAHLIIVAAPGYLADAGRPQRPSDLRQHSCIRDTNSDDPNRWPVEIEGTVTGIPVHGRLVCNSASAGLVAARAGHGLAMVPDLFAEYGLVAGDLERVLPQTATPSVPIQAVFLPSGFKRPKVTAFIDHMKTAITEAKARCASTQT